MFVPSQPFKPANITRDDSRPLKGIEHADTLYFPNRLEQRLPIVIVGLIQGNPRELNFQNKIACDLLVKGISADIKDDDGNELQPGTNTYRFSYVQFIIQTLDRDTRAVLRTINIYLSSYPNYLNELTLSPQYDYLVRTSKDVNSVTLLCEPLIQSDPVIFTPPITVANQ